MKQTHTLISELVDEIDLSFVASAVADNGNGTYTFTTTDTKWLTKGRTLDIDGDDYEITAVSFNQSVTVSGASLPSLLEFDIYAPQFYHGTVMAQNELMRLIQNANDKLPMIWLHEITRENFEPDEMLRLDRESDCDLYFLVDCKSTDWLTPDYDANTVKPMRQLVEAFISVLYDTPKADNDFRYEILDHAKFGVYQTDKGEVKKIFNDALSGCQVRITIPFLKELC